MSTTDKTTAIEAYNTFVSEKGTDFAAMTAEDQKTFMKLVRAKNAAEKEDTKEPSKRAIQIETDREEYTKICEENGITVSPKFAGWEDSIKPGAKKDGVATIAQHIVGVKMIDESEDLVKIISMVSPKVYTPKVVKAKKIFAARLLASA